MKSSLLKSCVFFKNPSVLSELERSAEEQIIFGTCSASTPKQAAEAARVAMSGFWVNLLQSICGALHENQVSFSWAFSGFSFAHWASAFLRSATIVRSSLVRSAYNFLTSSNITKGSPGFPPSAVTVLR